VVPAKYSTFVMGLLGEVVLAVSLMGASAILIAPFAGLAMVIVGALLTMIVTDVPSTGAPTAVTTRGVMTYVPAAKFGKVAVKGAAIALITAPLFTRYSTLVMAPGAVAAAVKFMFAGAVKIELFAGAVIETVGAAVTFTVALTEPKVTGLFVAGDVSENPTNLVILKENCVSTEGVYVPTTALDTL
jgi:hypothetical protein